MQDIIHALILGIVQGLTEFLPISSSGHLNVFPWIFKWEMLSEGMDVALHIGTLLALLIFFFKDWVALIKGGYNQTIKKKPSLEGKMFWYLVLATIPAGILSLILRTFANIFLQSLLFAPPPQRQLSLTSIPRDFAISILSLIAKETPSKTARSI